MIQSHRGTEKKMNSVSLCLCVLKNRVLSAHVFKGLQVVGAAAVEQFPFAVLREHVLPGFVPGEEGVGGEGEGDLGGLAGGDLDAEEAAEGLQGTLGVGGTADVELHDLRGKIIF